MGMTKSEKETRKAADTLESAANQLADAAALIGLGRPSSAAHRFEAAEVMALEALTVIRQHRRDIAHLQRGLDRMFAR